MLKTGGKINSNEMSLEFIVRYGNRESCEDTKPVSTNAAPIQDRLMHA